MRLERSSTDAMNCLFYHKINIIINRSIFSTDHTSVSHLSNIFFTIKSL